MLGPLPPLYRVVVALCGLLAFVGLGAWLAMTLPVPLVASAGAGIGAGIGVICVLLLVRQPPGHGSTHRLRPSRHR